VASAFLLDQYDVIGSGRRRPGLFIVFALSLLRAFPIVQGIQREPAGSMATCLIQSGSSRALGVTTR